MSVYVGIPFVAYGIQALGCRGCSATKGRSGLNRRSGAGSCNLRLP
jgi:hypothetical protein